MASGAVDVQMPCEGDSPEGNSDFFFFLMNILEDLFSGFLSSHVPLRLRSNVSYEFKREKFSCVVFFFQLELIIIFHTESMFFTVFKDLILQMKELHHLY